MATRTGKKRNKPTRANRVWANRSVDIFLGAAMMILFLLLLVLVIGLLTGAAHFKSCS